MCSTSPMRIMGVAAIVLSTFWRHFEEYIAYCLHRHGIPAGTVIGRTPGVSDASRLSNDPADAAHYAGRAAEIEAWLAEHKEVQRFCILDDRPSASNANLAPNFVQTASAQGFTPAHAERVRAILLGSAS